jgi:cob(I)alamin adenosyltransferase
MVYLNRIYTKAGDRGETMLGDGTRVPKPHPRIVAYGGVDELNSVIGVALAAGVAGESGSWLTQIQNDLFDVGADLCVPQSPPIPGRAPLRVTAAQVERLERWIDRLNERLAPLTSFVLPGGAPAAAHLHHARSVCRRVEIDVWRLSAGETINPPVMMYLNRLSDLLFVMARVANDDGRSDVTWIPGGDASDSASR